MTRSEYTTLDGVPLPENACLLCWRDQWRDTSLEAEDVDQAAINMTVYRCRSFGDVFVIDSGEANIIVHDSFLCDEWTRTFRNTKYDDEQYDKDRRDKILDALFYSLVVIGWCVDAYLQFRYSLLINSQICTALDFNRTHKDDDTLVFIFSMSWQFFLNPLFFVYHIIRLLVVLLTSPLF